MGDDVVNLFGDFMLPNFPEIFFSSFSPSIPPFFNFTLSVRFNFSLNNSILLLFTFVLQMDRFRFAFLLIESLSE